MYQTWLSFECVVGTWVSMLLFTEARTMGLGVPVFLYTSTVHAKCGGQNSQTIRVYAHTWNMTPSVSSMSSVTSCWVQAYWAYKYYMNFVLISFSFGEVDMSFFQIMDQLIWKNLFINSQD